MSELDRQVDAIVLAEWKDRVNLDALLAELPAAEVSARLRAVASVGEGRSRPTGPNAQPWLVRELLMNRLRGVGTHAA